MIDFFCMGPYPDTRTYDFKRRDREVRGISFTFENLPYDEVCDMFTGYDGECEILEHGTGTVLARKEA